jgi:hypothetical protein
VASVAITVGRSLVDLAEVIAWRAPKLLLVELPAWLFYHGPRSLAGALASRSERVAGLIASLEEEDDEGRLAAVEELRELTGLPLEDAAAWRAWWETAAERSPDRWLGDFVDRCLSDLEDEDFLVRQEADERLRTLSGIDVGFDAKGPEDERAEGVTRWREWRREHVGPGGEGR